MGKKTLLTGLAVLSLILIGTVSHGLAAEKVRLGAGIKMFMSYNLPVLAAEEKGLWQAGGLQVEFIPFDSGSVMIQASAAGSVDMGLVSAETVIRSAAAGVPLVILAHVITRGADFQLYVKKDSPIKEPKDIKGTKVGVGGLGSISHTYGKYITKTLGLERDVRFISAGGVQATVGVFRAGRVDAVLLTVPVMAELIVTGEVRKILAVNDLLPKPWVERIMMGRRDFVDANPRTAVQALKVFRQASEFLQGNRSWALEKMKSVYRLSEGSARLIYDTEIPNIEVGKIDKRALENINDFLINSGLLAKEKSLPIDAIYRGVLD